MTDNENYFLFYYYDYNTLNNFLSYSVCDFVTLDIMLDYIFFLSATCFSII